MDFDEALTYLQGRLRMGVKLGNDRFLALLDRLGNPQDRLRVIHIAGTKGKDSTTAMVASVLSIAGYKVGAYLSPYVYDVRERVQINGEMISREDFARWVSVIEPHVEALEGTELGATTEFELKTAIGLCYFAEQAVDFAVLEVGLGGRLDATNVISSPLVTVITNIGLDHTEILGETLGAIAAEKAGIIKPGIPCVTGVPVGGEAWEVIERICRERHAPLIPIQPPSDEAKSLTLTTDRRTLRGVQLRLRGAFQAQNAAAALTALDSISLEALPLVPNELAQRGLEAAWVPGRLQQVSEEPTVVVDVAHNEISASALADALRTHFQAESRRVILVVGLSRNHDPEAFLRPLAGLNPAALIATQPACRPRPAEDIAFAAQALGLPNIATVESSVLNAVRSALNQARPDDLICLTGSFYTVGDVPPAFWQNSSIK